jgi:HD-like signal output (HDOD) protein
MHDLGELVLLIRCPEEMQAIRTSFGEEPDGRALCDAEAAQFGFDHAAVGSALGSAWHFPATLVDCMAFHHAPADAHHDFGELVAIVHIANGCAALFDAPASEVPPSIEPATWAAAGIDATMLPEILERARERVESMQAALL